MSICQNVKRYRQEKGVSQESMGDWLNIDQSVYSRIERDDNKCLKRLTSIAKALNTTPEVLLNYGVSSRNENTIELTSLEDTRIKYEQSSDVDFLNQELIRLQQLIYYLCILL